MAPKILAMDQAKTSGIALGRAGETPRSWVLEAVKTKNEYEHFYEVQRQIHNLISTYEPDVFAFEKPFFSPKTATSGYKLMGAVGVIKAVLYERRVPIVHEIPSGTWKKGLCGSLKFNKKTRPYPPEDACHVRGWETGGSHDRADALGIWNQAVLIEAPELADGLPLFSV